MPWYFVERLSLLNFVVLILFLKECEIKLLNLGFAFLFREKMHVKTESASKKTLFFFFFLPTLRKWNSIILEFNRTEPESRLLQITFCKKLVP